MADADLCCIFLQYKMINANDSAVSQTHRREIPEQSLLHVWQAENTRHEVST